VAENTVLARLVYLSRAVDSLSIPIRTAENWVPPADLSQFIDHIETHVRALANLFHVYLLENPGTLSRWGNPENERCVEMEIADVRKNLDLIGRIGEPDRGSGKSSTEIVKEQIHKTFIGPDSETGFAAEAEELRRLRSGELKLGSSLPKQSPQQTG
jgi:hypothetical protein